LPFILLILDYWPLERISLNVNVIGKLVIEKLPFFLMASGSSLITVIAQHSAISGFNRIDLSIRISNALTSYCVYLGQAFWPAKLAIFYPYILHPNFVHGTLCAILLVVISALVVWFGSQKKYLLTGWLWFLVTLVPVIGIVQVGDQAHADRYTYIPFVGIFLMVVWGIKPIIEKIHTKKRIPFFMLFAVIFLAMVAKTTEQVGYWKNSITLFSHTANVTKNNTLAYMNLGLAFEKTGQIQNALESYQKAVDVEPQYEDAHYNLATVLANLSRLDEAIYHFKKACEIAPNNPKTLNNLGVAYMQTYQLTEAIPVFQKALPLAQTAGDTSLAQTIAENLELVIKERDSLEAVVETNAKK
jgi:tetratricopeptide (TPR) repeat protein